MKKGVLFLLIILLSSVTIAANVDIDIKPIKDSVLSGEQADFQVNINNNLGYSENFKISAFDLNWLQPDDSIRSLSVSNDKSASGELKFYPLSDVKPASYGIKVVIEYSGNKIERIVPITLMDPTKLATAKIIGPPIDPRKESTLKLELKNNYDVKLEKLTVKLSSDIFEESISADLEPSEIKDIDIPLKLSPSVKEGDHDVSMMFFVDRKFMRQVNDKSNIAYYPGLREIVTPKKSLLVSSEIIQKINDGNAVVKESYVKELSSMQRLFTRTSPDPDSVVKKDSTYLYRWDLNLQPGESKVISIQTNYRDPILAFIILVIFASYAYSQVRRHVSVQKKVLTMKVDDKNKLKIVITIKNKTGKLLKNIKILERVPHMAKSPGEYGTVPPTKIIKEGNHLNLMWMIPSLAPNEERVFSYKIETVIRGRLVLPTTLVKYGIDNKILATNSNAVSVSGE